MLQIGTLDFQMNSETWKKDTKYGIWKQEDV